MYNREKNPCTAVQIFDEGRCRTKEKADIQMRKRNSGENNIRRMTVGCILFAASFLLLFLGKKVPGAAQWYSEHIYKWIVAVIGRVSGIFPFSLAEAGLYLFMAAVLSFFARTVYCIVRKKEAGAAVNFFSGLFLTASVLFTLYTVNCGINYYRVSFAKSTGIHTDSYTEKDLADVCRWLTEEVNEKSSSVRRDKNGVMVLKGNIAEEAVKAMENLGDTYEELSGHYPQPKGLFFPWILSVQNLTGVYSPFTVEANYNNAVTDYNIPFTACHELSHLRGFMREEEANFIGFLACREAESEEFQYSAGMMGWIYCMSLLKSTDYEEWLEIRNQLSQEAEADLRANDQFWSLYEGMAAEVANRVNDTYLKANGQENGVESYDRMADMIVAYYLLNEQER